MSKKAHHFEVKMWRH